MGDTPWESDYVRKTIFERLKAAAEAEERVRKTGEEGMLAS